MSEINHPQAHFRFPPEIDIEKEMRHAIEKKKMPRFLFKYMTIKGAMRFLENAELLYSRPSDFNDPFPSIPLRVRNISLNGKYSSTGRICCDLCLRDASSQVLLSDFESGILAGFRKKIAFQC